MQTLPWKIRETVDPLLKEAPAKASLYQKELFFLILILVINAPSTLISGIIYMNMKYDLIDRKSVV